MNKGGGYPDRNSSTAAGGNSQPHTLAGLDSMAAQLFHQHQQRQQYHQQLMSVVTLGLTHFPKSPSNFVSNCSFPKMTYENHHGGGHFQRLDLLPTIPSMPYQHVAAADYFSMNTVHGGDQRVQQEINYHRRLQAMMEQDIADMKRMMQLSHDTHQSSGDHKLDDDSLA